MVEREYRTVEEVKSMFAHAMAQRGMAVAVIADILGISEQDVSRLLAVDSAR